MSKILGLFKLVVAGAASLAFLYLMTLAGGALFSNRALKQPVYVVEKQDSKPAEDPAQQMSFDELLAQADVSAGQRVFKQCAACHKVEEGVNAVGPSLYGVVGRPVHAISDFQYSDALKALDGEWTAERLDAFVTDPKAYAPGTKMTFNGLSNPQDRANVIAYLQSVAQ
jgi:cytochrome c